MDDELKPKRQTGKKLFILALGVAYVLWPVDLMPGLPIDDIAVMIYAWYQQSKL